jgi:hypothetical protein
VLRLDGAWDGEGVDGGNPKRCQATAVQERRMRNLTRRRERLGVAQVPQLPKTFCGNEGVLECSGLTELWMGRASMGEIQSGVKPPQSKKQGSGISREDAKARKVGGSPSAAVIEDVLWK